MLGTSVAGCVSKHDELGGGLHLLDSCARAKRRPEVAGDLMHQHRHLCDPNVMGWGLCLTACSPARVSPPPCLRIVRTSRSRSFTALQDPGGLCAGAPPGTEQLELEQERCEAEAAFSSMFPWFCSTKRGFSNSQPRAGASVFPGRCRVRHAARRQTQSSCLQS